MNICNIIAKFTGVTDDTITSWRFEEAEQHLNEKKQTGKM